MSIYVMTKRQNRIQLLLTDEELDAVNEWQDRQNIGSRNEALRQLLLSGFIHEFQNFPPEAYPDILKKRLRLPLD